MEGRAKFCPVSRCIIRETDGSKKCLSGGACKRYEADGASNRPPSIAQRKKGEQPADIVNAKVRVVVRSIS